MYTAIGQTKPSTLNLKNAYSKIIHHPQKTNQCTPKRGHFKRKVIFHPLFFWRHVSFPWSKAPSLPLFAQLVCVCVWFFFINLSLQGMISLYSPERIPTKRFLFLPFLFGRLCSIFLAFLGFVTALWGFKLYGVFFQVFLVMFIQVIQTTFI